MGVTNPFLDRIYRYKLSEDMLSIIYGRDSVSPFDSDVDAAGVFRKVRKALSSKTVISENPSEIRALTTNSPTYACHKLVVVVPDLGRDALYNSVI